VEAAGYGFYGQPLPSVFCIHHTSEAFWAVEAEAVAVASKGETEAFGGEAVDEAVLVVTRIG